MTEEKRAPCLLPLTVGLSVLLWVFTTTGGRQILIKEALGDAYDSQAEHLLRGDPGVDGEAIRYEVLVVKGKSRMYFGPFPAFLRIPLNLIYPAGRGRWSRVSGFCAGVIALFAFAGLLRESLRSAPLSARARSWLGNACLAGFALGSPLLFLLGNLSIYNEAVAWGLAWSLAALFFAYRSRTVQGVNLTGSLLGFSFCAEGALLSRVTFGAPLVLIAPLLALRLPPEQRVVRVAALFLPLATGLAFYLLLNYAKFGTLLGMTYDYYVNPVHREFARQHGIFNLLRVPSSFADYFSLRFPSLQTAPPFLRADRHAAAHPALYSLPISEVFLSVPWCSGWLLLGAVCGLVLLFQTDRADGIERWTAAALLVQFAGILSYFALAQRYTADLYPFLILCLIVFLRAGGTAMLRVAMVVLVAVSIVINSLATVSWLVDRDPNVPVETQAIWKTALGRQSPSSQKVK